MKKRIIVTKPGVSALSNPDPRNVNFDSDLPSLKYYTQGSIEIYGTAGTFEDTITHNLGYIPFFTAYVGSFNVPPFQMVPLYTVGGPLDAYFLYTSVWADATRLYFQASHNVPATTYYVDFYYKIFRNNLGL